MNRLTTRRQCLPLLLSALAASCCNRPGEAGLATSDEIERLRCMLTSLSSEWLCIHDIAAACVRVLPGEEISPPALMLAILGRTSICLAEWMTAATVRQIIAKRIHVDFLRHDTVCADGWILSMTEARLYALAGTSKSA